MNRKMIMAVIAVCFLTVIPAWSSEEPFATGSDWKTRMSLREKFMSIVSPMSTFHRYGVPFRYAAEEYLPKVDRVIAANPSLDDEEVANIFASAVYLYEPESRPYFDGLEGQFLRGDTEFKAVRLRPQAE